MHNNKTMFQRFYSFFGFWTYLHHEDDNVCHLVIYWCFFPWFKFFWKIDVLHINVSQKHSINTQKKQLANRLLNMSQEEQEKNSDLLDQYRKYA